MKSMKALMVLLLSFPIFAFAIEPTNPAGICDRFISEKDTELCQNRAEKDEVDWYATTICNLQKSDNAFWNCWDSIKGKSFNPQALEKCSDGEGLSDEQRQGCLNAAKGERRPASDDAFETFQKIKIKGRY